VVCDVLADNDSRGVAALSSAGCHRLKGETSLPLINLDGREAGGCGRNFVNRGLQDSSQLLALAPGCSQCNLMHSTARDWIRFTGTHPYELRLGRMRERAGFSIKKSVDARNPQPAMPASAGSDPIGEFSPSSPVHAARNSLPCRLRRRTCPVVPVPTRCSR
jgi:hypothetical protein